MTSQVFTLQDAAVKSIHLLPGSVILNLNICRTNDRLSEFKSPRLEFRKQNLIYFSFTLYTGNRVIAFLFFSYLI